MNDNTPTSSKLWNDPALVSVGLALLEQPMTHDDIFLANQFIARIVALDAERRRERPKV